MTSGTVTALTRTAAVAMSLISALVVAGCGGPAETDAPSTHARETSPSTGGSADVWADAGDVLLRDGDGDLVVDPDFDFAVTEECAAFAECAAYTEVYGDAVLQIEYPDSLAEAGLTFSEACDGDDRAPLTILRDRDLVAASESGYRYESCPEDSRP